MPTPRQQAAPHRVPWFFGLTRLFRRHAHPIPAEADEPGDFMGDVAEWWERQFRLAGDRRERYRIFDEMDTFDLVMGILELYAEETTQPDYDKQRSVWIESKNAEMVRAGDECLRNCAVEDRITALIRRVAKYGDAFQRLLYATGKGVLGWRYVSPAKIHRLEDKYGRLIGFREDGKSFRQKTRPVSWPWDYIHFRMLGKDEESGYGTSMLEALFRPWRQMCLAPGTLVWTTGGPVPVEKLQPGMETYCHDPETTETRETRVVAVLSMGEQQLLRVRTAHRQILVTENHGLLVRDAAGKFSYKRAKDLIANGGVGRENWQGYQHADSLVLPALTFGADRHEIHLPRENYTVLLDRAASYESPGVMERIRSCGLSTSDKNAHAFLNGLRPIPYTDYARMRRIFDLPPAQVFYRRGRKPAPFGTDLTFTADARFVRFLGFMLGDGWVKQNSVGFALGVEETQNTRYIELFRIVFGVETYHRAEAEPGVKGAQVHFHSAAVADLFREAGFLTGFAKKEIPEWVYGLTPGLKRELIFGLLDADGSEQSGGWRLMLANQPLVEQVVTLCQQAGLHVSREIAEIRREDRKPAYRVYISGADNDVDRPVVYEPVTHVDPAGSGPTYDLQVEDDLHNFVANGIVSHNTLAEDSLLMFRLRRAPDRNLVEIDVGDMEEHEAMQFVNAWRKKFRKTEFVDPASPDYKKQYNPLTPLEDIWLPKRPEQATTVQQLSGGGNIGEIYDLDHFRRKFFGAARVPQAYFGYEGEINCFKLATRIPCLDGKTRTLRQIIDRYEATGELPGVYSYDPKTQKIVPGEVTWAGVTRPDAEVVEVELDDGTKHVCTPEHRWYTLDGRWVEAAALVPGTQLLPLRRSVRGGGASAYRGYEVVHDPFGGAQLTHLRVADAAYPGARSVAGRALTHCHHCDIQFETFRSRLTDGKDRYCSRVCYSLACATARERTCAYCGVSFDAPKPTSRWCSKSCTTAWRNKASAGRIPVPNHRVLAVRRLLRRYDTGDITVRSYHNFFVADAARGGVLVHNSKSTLLQQDVRFARGAKRLRKAGIYGLRQLLDIHFTLLAQSATDQKYNFAQDANAYLVQMSPIAYLDEFERLELIQLRYQIIDAMSRLANDLNLDARVWATYVLLHYAKLPEDLVTKLINKTPPGPPPAAGAAVPGEETPESARIRALLAEVEDDGLRQRIASEVHRQRIWTPMNGKGYYTVSPAEARLIAEAVHTSAGLRGSIFNLRMLFADDIAEAQARQTDATLLPVTVGGAPLADDFADDQHARELREDLVAAGVQLTENQPAEPAA